MIIFVIMKWSDKILYPWVEWIEALIGLGDDINNIAYGKREPWGFLIFLMGVITTPIRWFAIGTLAIIQTFEWAFFGKVTEFIHNRVERNGELNAKDFIAIVLLGFGIMAPLMLTWGLPAIIRDKRKDKREKELERIRLAQEQREREWGVIREEIVELEARLAERREAKDFKPKKRVTPHNFNNKRKTILVSPGVYVRDVWDIEEVTRRQQTRRRRYE
jgi:signal transduction histidine kinase